MFHADVCIVKVAHASSLNWDGGVLEGIVDFYLLTTYLKYTL